MKRLLIVADHSLIVHAIRLALRQTTGFEVVGFIDGRQSLQDHLLESQPDIVLIDEMHVRDHMLSRVREAVEHVPNVQVFLLSNSMDEESLAEAFGAGVRTVLSKDADPVTLGTLLRAVTLGQVVHHPDYPKSSVPATDSPLTERELQILRLAAQGYPNRRIALELWVTEQTVKFHLSNTYRKLGVANRTEASRYAHLNGLIAPDASEAA